MNFDLIIKKIMSKKGFDDEKEVAKLFGLSGPDLSNRKKRGSLLPFIVDWAINENVNLDWLIKDKDDLSEAKTVISADPSPLYLTEVSPERKKKLKLGNMLNRIIEEGDPKKIKAVESQLDLLDPGEKKPVSSHEDDGGGGYMGGSVA
ncbi:MAG: helix-turn-helix domain-containing protein [Desulfuromonadaceae bacterium]|nr:helix-turn-helix domain-containing protein [Desulfuromonadaceae bacterium]MDD5107605.1 helix-turn-helix domain-containing protein [Desulfuromonadaceae bacterium]